jgi:glyoxylase-like metal-dependent hydrolase (beta-lactamase superfamily II)
MNALPDPLVYPYDSTPPFGKTKEVAAGVYWLQMPLPMSLNHINLYLLEGKKGWTVVDTGLRGQETSDLWQEIFDNELQGKPIDQVLCTHMHPDHTGQAGFISEYWHAPLLMSCAEYYQARVMSTMMREGGSWQMSDYFVRAGMDQGILDKMREARSSFSPEPEDKPLPGSFIRLGDGDSLQIGDNHWQIITGNGHSPEHVCLYCKELRVLISGDQILPVITSNVSVQPTEPFANPMVGWLESHERFKTLLPNDILVLPAHNNPFYGVQERLQQLIDHHEDRMLLIEENCREPQKAIDLLPHLFKRKLEDYSLFMGLGECIAHIHCLMSRNRIERSLENGVYLYRSIDPTLTERARPGLHEEPDDSPLMV